MRYKNVGDTITFFLSEREVSNYDDGRLGLKTEGNVIVDYGRPFKVQDGTYPIVVNGHHIDLSLKVGETDSGYVAKAVANGYPFEVTSTEELNKYQVYRGIVRHLKHIAKEPAPRTDDWHVLEVTEHHNELYMIVAADDPDAIEAVQTIEAIDRYAEEKGFTQRKSIGLIQRFGQNELARREFRYAR